MLKYALLLAVVVTAYWYWRRASPRSRKVAGAIFLVLLATGLVFLVILPLVDPGGSHP